MITSQPSITIFYFNSNCLKNQEVEFERTLKKLQVDVAFVSETFLKSKHSFKVSGYDVIRHDAPDHQHGGGIAIIVKRDIRYEERKVPRTESFPWTLGIRIGISLNESVDFVGVYVPNSISKILKRDFAQLIRLNEKVIIVGDFNAQHKFWNCRSLNPRGKSLMDCIAENNGRVYINFPDEPTFFPRDSKKCPSTIDLCITKSIGLTKPPKSLSLLSSDHNPVIAQVDSRLLHSNSHQQLSYKEGDWEKYQELFCNKVNTIPSPCDEVELEQAVENFTKIMKEAERVCVPVRDPNDTGLPQFIVRRITEKNAIRRAYQKTVDPNLKNELKFELRKNEKMIKKLKQNWELERHQS